jgi:ribosomal protein S18 acetylase RimI-like enzyme
LDRGVAPPSVRIETLQRPDDPEVLALLVELGLEDQERYDHPKETREEIAGRTGPLAPSFRGENVVFVARDEKDHAIGLCWCVLFDPGNGLEGEVAELYVLPAARGGGVATALVGEAMRLFREREATFVTVWTRADNPAALAVYRRHGFQPTEQTVLTWLPLTGAEPASEGTPGAGIERDADNHAP